MSNPKDLLNQSIISLLGLQALSPEEKKAMVEKMSSLVEKRLFVRLVDQLSEADKEEMAKLLDSPEQALAFLDNSVPNLGEIVAEEVNKLKEELVEAADQV